MRYSERLWAYQAERFPLKKTVPLLALFAVAAIHVSAVLAGRALPGPMVYLASFALGLIVFFEMRVADEHKDYEDDLRYRPERPVQRGLITLKQLRSLGIGLGLVAMAIAAATSWTTLWCLIATAIWFALMTREFFVPDWLKARPILYLISHMAIMPLIALTLTSFEWAGPGMPASLWLFLALSFANGCVLEIGRKIWAPENERDGVETYSKLWGAKRAALIWAGLCVLPALLLSVFATRHSAAGWLFGVAAAMLFFSALAAMRFTRQADSPAQDRIDLFSGLTVAISYGALAIFPLLEGTT